jgi:hypothetical protein
MFKKRGSQSSDRKTYWFNSFLLLFPEPLLPLNFDEFNWGCIGLRMYISHHILVGRWRNMRV